MTSEEIRKEAYRFQRNTQKMLSSAWSAWRSRMREKMGIAYLKAHPQEFTQRAFLVWYKLMTEAAEKGQLVDEATLAELPPEAVTALANTPSTSSGSNVLSPEKST